MAKQKATRVAIESDEQLPDFSIPTEEKVELKEEEVLPENEEVIYHEPSSKLVYSYHPVSRKFAGCVNAFECPIEKGKFNLPANSTDVDPPKPTEGKDRVFVPVKNKWEVVDTPKEEKNIVEKTKAQLETEARNKRNRLLSESDYTQLPDFPGNKEDATLYRKLLRDITNQKGFPKNIDWPVKKF